MSRVGYAVCFSAVLVRMFWFFFFQAEDGIRDLTVTGVQTCALPISRSFGAGDCFIVPKERVMMTGEGYVVIHGPLAGVGPGGASSSASKGSKDNEDQIGRASCRERV